MSTNAEVDLVMESALLTAESFNLVPGLAVCQVKQ